MQKSEQQTNRLTAAFSLAAELHAPQLRKGTNIPYISHAMAVSALIMEYGGDEDQAIAGLLHDVVEDCGTQNLEVIREKLGNRVAAIVEACTDGVPDAKGEKPDWRQRKEAYLAHLEHAETDILLVSAADKLHNDRAILSDLRSIGPAVFDRFKAGRGGTLWYYSRLAEIFQGRLPGPLASELARTVEAIHGMAR
jgi:(p)ppGpp synthase/HD superfamily hydrolase